MREQHVWKGGVGVKKGVRRERDGGEWDEEIRGETLGEKLEFAVRG